MGVVGVIVGHSVKLLILVTERNRFLSEDASVTIVAYLAYSIMRLIFLLLLILSNGIFTVYGQKRLTASDTLTGEWKGKYTFRGQSAYKLTIQIKQTGPDITGKQQQDLAGGSWARCKIAGKRMGDSVDFSEVRVTENHNPDYDNLYCLYRIRGVVQRDGDYLEIHGSATPTGIQYEQDVHVRNEACLNEPTGNYSARMLSPLKVARELPQDTVRETRPLEPPPVQDTSHVLAQPAKPKDLVTPKRPALAKAPARLEKTKVETVHTFEADSASVMVEYRDNMTIDGDVISLNLDGKRWLVQKAKLQRAYKKTRIALTGDAHYLILYAENAGNGGKNTATIRLTSGKMSKTYDMTSDGGTSQAIRIVRK